MTVRYRHDCEHCEPLGQLGRFDVYRCPQRAVGIPTVVARFGDDGPEYLSGSRLVLEVDDVDVILLAHPDLTRTFV